MKLVTMFLSLSVLVALVAIGVGGTTTGLGLSPVNNATIPNCAGVLSSFKDSLGNLYYGCPTGVFKARFLAVSALINQKYYFLIIIFPLS